MAYNDENMAEYLRDNFWAFQDRTLEDEDLLDIITNGVEVYLGDDNDHNWFSESDLQDAGDSVLERIEQSLMDDECGGNYREGEVRRLIKQMNRVLKKYYRELENPEFVLQMNNNLKCGGKPDSEDSEDEGDSDEDTGGEQQDIDQDVENKVDKVEEQHGNQVALQPSN